MTDSDWAVCNNVNKMFGSIITPTDDRLAEFNLSCCNRIRRLIDNDASLEAVNALGSRPADPDSLMEVAQAACGVANPIGIPTMAMYARKAVAHAVRCFLPEDHRDYCDDGLENSRLVALYSVWAVTHEADEPSNKDEDGSDVEPGTAWIWQQAEQKESMAVCDLIRTYFQRRT